MIEPVARIKFPKFTGARCLMMPYIQGDPMSVPSEYRGYSEILENVYLSKGDIGFLTIDESENDPGKPHRGARSKTDRAIHTEVGRRKGEIYAWGGGSWGGRPNVTLDRDAEILLANNTDETCAVWDAVHEDTSDDGDIGHCSEMYPYEDAVLMKSGDVYKIGILTPHESLPINGVVKRQFLRIISSGVHGREPYFTRNPVLEVA